MTPRRWLLCCFFVLSILIVNTLGDVDEWITTMTTLRDLAPYSDEEAFVGDFIEVKKNNKRRLQKWIKDHTGYSVPLDAMYDVMVKRIHEYKRQLMNAFFIINRYL